MPIRCALNFRVSSIFLLVLAFRSCNSGRICSWRCESLGSLLLFLIWLVFVCICYWGLNIGNVFSEGVESAVVTLDSIVIYKTHEWIAAKPTVYFHCQGGNKTKLPDVQKEHVLYSFNGEESWQVCGILLSCFELSWSFSNFSCLTLLGVVISTHHSVLDFYLAKLCFFFSPPSNFLTIVFIAWNFWILSQVLKTKNKMLKATFFCEHLVKRKK